MKWWLSGGPLNITFWILPLVLLLTLIYRYGTQRFGIWQYLGVPGPKPWPFIGTAAAMLHEGVRVFDQNCVSKYGELVGLYEGSVPVLLVTNPELLKQVFVKDFNSFMNRTASPLFTNKDNFVFRATLTRLMGDHWKHVRSQLTPTFSAVRLRSMMPELCACAELLLDNLAQHAGGESVNVKDFSGAFSMDVIARTAFGLNIDSQKDPKNPFVCHAKKVFEAKHVNWRLLSLLLFPFLAKITKYFGQNHFPPGVVEFFSEITSEAMQRRKENGETRIDFLQLMLDHKICADCQHEDQGDSLNWNKQGLTHEEILAQSLLFFIAGYETTASAITFLCYNLATNMSVQKKLQLEIDRVVEKQQTINYDLLTDLPYLDMCVQETLRLYPPATRILRACNQDTTLGDLLIRRGTLIAIPVYTLHHSNKYWNNPEVFIPERFSAEDKTSRIPFTWIPFGAGPRNCIGMRLATMEIKVAMVTLVKHLEFHVTRKTEVPLKFKKNTILSTERPIYLAVKLRRK